MEKKKEATEKAIAEQTSQRVGPNAFISNFSTIYTNKGKEIEPTTVTGAKLPEKILEHYESRYNKKFPFERSQYHQCVPNPFKDNEFVTVQLVTRQMESYTEEGNKKSKSL